jgi:hypothetical protein
VVRLAAGITGPFWGGLEYLMCIDLFGIYSVARAMRKEHIGLSLLKLASSPLFVD